MIGHVFTVEFRIFSATLDLEAITNELGLQSCQIRNPGDLRADGKAFTGMWAYNGLRKEDGPDWESLEEGLTFVLDKLWPHKQLITAYQPKADLVWWCGHFQSSFDGGPRLSPTLLARLGEFGAELFIDNYFSREEAAF
jgi:hypothetical protein